MFTALLVWIFVGVLAGFVATKFVNLEGDDPRLGVALAAAAAALGGILYTTMSGTSEAALNLWSLLFAFTAALVALGVWHGLRYRAAELHRRRQPRAGRRYR